MKRVTESDLVAPCGMYCGACRAYLAYSRGISRKTRKVTYCQGCLPRGKMCAFLKGSCPAIRTGKIRFCYECDDFPCRRLLKIDERYRTRYDTSFVENLRYIEKNGIDAFLKQQKRRFQCGACGGTLSIHDGFCFDCASDKIPRKEP